MDEQLSISLDAVQVALECLAELSRIAPQGDRVIWDREERRLRTIKTKLEGEAMDERQAKCR
jgi:hypothetical protein